MVMWEDMEDPQRLPTHSNIMLVGGGASAACTNCTDAGASAWPAQQVRVGDRLFSVPHTRHPPSPTTLRAYAG